MSFFSNSLVILLELMGSLSVIALHQNHANVLFCLRSIHAAHSCTCGSSGCEKNLGMCFVHAKAAGSRALPEKLASEIDVARLVAVR